LIGKYIADTGFYDGLVVGKEYQLQDCEDATRYLVLKNELGATSTLLKDKFVNVKDELLVAAEKAAGGEI